MASSLPTNPSLDRLKVDARRLQRGITAARRRGRRPRPAVPPEAVARIGLALDEAPSRFALHDAQLTVARRYGFTGWPALVHYLEVAAELSVDPSAVDEDALDPADLFCALSALRYDGTDAPPRRQAAAACSRPTRHSSTGTCGRRPQPPIPGRCDGTWPPIRRSRGVRVGRSAGCRCCT